MNKILSIQVLRALAAVMVATHHVWLVSTFGADSPVASQRAFFTMAALGVDIFFCISGFLMVVTLRQGLDGAPLARAFLTSRVERIYPIYMICVGVLVAGAFAAAALGFKFKAEIAQAGLGQIAGNLLLAPALPGQTDYFPFLPQAWTLVYEMYFYVVFTLCLLAGRRRIVSSLAVVLGGVFLAFHFVIGQGEQGHWINLRYMVGDPLVLNLLFGSVLGGAYAKGWLRPVAPRLKPLALAAIVALLAAAFLAPEGTPRLLQLGLPSLAALAVAVCYGLEPGPAARPLVYLGEASYSIYLTHIFVAFVAYQIAHATPWAADLDGLLLSVAAVALGCACYSLVEKPIIEALRQRRRVGARLMPRRLPRAGPGTCARPRR